MFFALLSLKIAAKNDQNAMKTNKMCRKKHGKNASQKAITQSNRQLGYCEEPFSLSQNIRKRGSMDTATLVRINLGRGHA